MVVILILAAGLLCLVASVIAVNWSETYRRTGHKQGGRQK
jgi:hypothetical protein